MNKVALFIFVLISLAVVSLIAFIVIPEEYLTLSNQSTFENDLTDSQTAEFQFLDQPNIPLNEAEQAQSDDAESSQVELIAVGDIMLARSVNTSMIRRNDWKYPFLQTAEVLQQADLLFGNLESPMGPDCSYTDEGMRFCANPLSLEGLVFAGFDVMSLANNHGYDQGTEGYEFTKEQVSSAGIAPVGFNETTEIVVSNANGGSVKVGFAAFDDTLRSLDLNVVEEKIAELATTVDVVIASFHWGIEYSDQPSDRQREIAQVAAQAGSQLILGHHPHWVQTVEEIIVPTEDSDALNESENKNPTNRTVVFYSLGNFVFDQMWSQETRTGQVAFITLDTTGVVSYETKTVEIFDYSQPRFIDASVSN